MGRLRVNYKEMSKFMKSQGYYEHRQSSSTHIIYKNKITGHTLPVPKHKGTLCEGTIAKVLLQMNSSRNELDDFINKKKKKLN